MIAPSSKTNIRKKITSLSLKNLSVSKYSPQCIPHVQPLRMAIFTYASCILPTYAGTGKVFDFNATLPAIVVQFLLLMVFLDKTWFGPVGKVLDERDAKIRSRLKSAKTGSEELDALQNEADTLLKEARAEAKSKI